MKTYLITGGAGFIGSNLAEELLKENKVVIIDNLSSGFLHNLPISKNVNFFNKNCIELYLYNELKMFNISIPDLPDGKSIILKPMIKHNEVDKLSKSFMEIQITDFDYSYFLSELN